jgi:methylenetetrahydrofolate dehydrogenase (NADP+)/methenyltetrahydrofolate cyclohydrolase
MSARILDGTKIGNQIKEEVKIEVAKLKEGEVIPGLAAVLVGNNPASQVYVRNKIKTCESLGIYSEFHSMPEETSTTELLARVRELNSSEKIDGILVQLPLPKQIDELVVLLAVDPAKDVDGLHPVNAGRLALGHEGLFPCTPSGVVEILRRENIPIQGSRVVIVGRSNLVGKPLMAILMQKQAGANATITICHTGTKNMAQITRQADILVAAMGSPKIITADMVKDGAVVIDVGVNRIPDATKKTGFRLVGDTDFDAIKEKAKAITPVPGGVGPMTVTMLMVNTVRAAEMRLAAQRQG